MIFKPTTKERRRDPRLLVSRPVKLCCTLSGKYLRGSTHDISASGALINLDQPTNLTPGQAMMVGIAWTNRDVMLRADQMVPATVTRCLGLDGKLSLAVRFTEPQDLALSA